MEFVVREDSRREAMVGGGAAVRRVRRRWRAVGVEKGDAVDGLCDDGDGDDGVGGCGGSECAVVIYFDG